MGWNYVSIPKLQRLHRGTWAMDKQFHRTLYNRCDYLSMLGLIYVNERTPDPLTMDNFRRQCFFVFHGFMAIQKPLLNLSTGNVHIVFHKMHTLMSNALTKYTNEMSAYGARALSYYSDLTLSQEFQPMAAQLSMKAALPLDKILATASCCRSKTGPRATASMSALHGIFRCTHCWELN